MAEYEKLTLVEVFKAREQGNLDEIQFSFVDESPLTAGDVVEQAKAIQRVLQKKGFKKGDRVAVLGENSPQWGVSYLAAGTMGGIVVPILPDFHKSEVHHILKNSEANSLFVSFKLFNYSVLISIIFTDNKCFACLRKLRSQVIKLFVTCDTH